MRRKGFEKPSFFLEGNGKKKKPDLILLDIMLPEEDGISILKKAENPSGYKKSFRDHADGKRQRV